MIREGEGVLGGEAVVGEEGGIGDDWREEGLREDGGRNLEGGVEGLVAVEVVLEVEDEVVVVEEEEAGLVALVVVVVFFAVGEVEDDEEEDFFVDVSVFSFSFFAGAGAASDCSDAAAAARAGSFFIAFVNYSSIYNKNNDFLLTLRITCDGLTKIPCSGGQLKYLIPCTSPSFLPTTMIVSDCK